jgi:Cu(I)/Ag(I) efflux system membrane protein CusA/SilA
VTTTLLEAIITATVCVLLVLLHFRTSFIIALTLPLAALASFAVMLTLRRLGIADIQTNIMSLAGIAISIGVLVDASIVMAENVMHHLKNHFGEEPVRGDIRELVLPACLTVGRPIFFSVAIMLLSFLPVFALSGIEGKMFRPLAFTKSFALLAVAVFAITLVPALCTIFIKGRLRRETDSWLLRGVMEVYRPVLSYCLAKPTVLIWIISLTLLIGFAPLGSRLVSLGTLFLAIVVTASVANGWLQRSAVVLSLIVAALLADQFIQPLGREFMPPLDEGMVMDMPITVPRASVVQSTDDLKARDMIFCRFPEVDMVVGKAGRAETPTDPAPLDMIETMINFRPAEYWPKRKLRPEDARRHAQVVLQAMVDKSWIKAPADARARENLVEETVTAVMPAFDAQMREYAYQRNQEFTRDLGRRLARIALETMVGMIGQNSTLTRELGPSDITLLAEGLPADLASRLALESSLEDITTVAHDVARKLTQLKWTRPDADLFEYRPNVVFRAAIAVHTTLGGTAPNFFTHLQTKVLARRDAFWREHIAGISRDLASRAGQVYTRLVIEDFLTRCPITDDRIAKAINEIHRARAQVSSTRDHASGHHHGTRDAAAVLSIEPQPEINSLQEELSGRFTQNVFLWRKDRADLVGFGGELDKVMQMPGWTNVWTMPIQNRVDMLSTGVNTTLGVRVLGRKLDDVVRASEEIADLLKRLPGASDVVADPVRGKGYLQIEIDREKAAGYGINVGDVNDVIETALGGKLATTVFEGRERHPVRIRFPRAWRESEESVANIPIALPMAPRANDSAPVESGDGRSLLRQVPLSQVAAVRITEGPTSIKSDNGLLRNYVRLNVHDRDVADFVEEARHAVAERIQLPAGVYIEWTGQFEHEIHARTTLMLIVPLVIALIIFILYQTYHDLADTFLMVLAVPGALAGGVFFQWLFGYKLSVTVFVGYIACFGMATATGVIMLVYLREAVAKAGGLKDITLQQLKDAVMTGAVHRLRPKLLTEATIVIGLAPMLWANGTGAEIIKPMAAPVLGGILIADEVIDLLLPVLFYWVRRWRWEKLHRQAVAKVT